jgi:SAM-dependent methyltransferase
MTNYQTEYRRQRAACGHQPKSRDDWDTRAQAMGRDVLTGNSYNRELLRCLDFSGCRDLLDVCCGPGNLLIPAAAKLQHVYGFDFSRAMLAEARRNAQQLGVKNMTLFELDRDAAWDDVPRADVVTASRCMDVPDMRAMALKLNAWARRRVYFTYRVDRFYLEDALMEAIGRTCPPRPDHMLVMNVLHECGLRASLNFITSTGKVTRYRDVKDFVARVEWTVPELTETERERVELFYAALPREGNIRLHRHSICWALFGWEKTE